MEDWGNFPLWSPHQHHISKSLVRCKTQTQQRLRAQGMLNSQDIITPSGQPRTWIKLNRSNADQAGRKAYEALVSNLHDYCPWIPAFYSNSTSFLRRGHQEHCVAIQGSHTSRHLTVEPHSWLLSTDQSPLSHCRHPHPATWLPRHSSYAGTQDPGTLAGGKATPTEPLWLLVLGM